MKTFGYIALILGCLSLVGAIMAHLIGGRSICFAQQFNWV